MQKLCFLVLILASSSAVMGQQVSPAAIGSGYALPAPISAAPGQLVTLIVQGLGSSITQAIRAPVGSDLPTTLASRHFGELLAGYPAAGANSRGASFHDALWPISFCPGQEAGCSHDSSPSRRPVMPAGGLEIEVQPFADQVHILTNCDPFMTSANSAAFNPTGLPCPSIVAHPDGSLVSVTNPATAGEELAAYAVGLGQTTPSITGQLVTKSAPTQTAFILDFNYRPNALATKPLPNGPQPLFAGTTAGYVGLYQINFVVPPVPAGTPACVDGSKLFPPGQNIVQSNLTVSVGGMFSFDGAIICVAVANPQSVLPQD